MNEVMKQIGIGKRKMAKVCMKQEGIIQFSTAYHFIRNFSTVSNGREINF